MEGQSWKSWVLGVGVGAALVAAPVLAQSSLSVADAAPFMGAWTIVLDTPQGAMPMDVNVKDTNGMVTGEIGSDMMGVQTITDVTKSDASLVMKYNLDMQGNVIPIQLTLTPDGDAMKFALDAGAGQFFIEGAATKKP